MTDIYDIKHIFLPWNDFIVSTIITIVLFLIVYFLLFKKKKKSVEIIEKVDEIEKEKTSFRELILNFEKSCFSLETTDFLKELSFIFRTFLEEEK
ncbi:MAG: hypothetical protein LBC61_06510 [Candidatus Peribacteria bacterium]|jgi:hypothetical protein|nr:hypothetical protein [Candidatus Peribacteria bacterium]